MPNNIAALCCSVICALAAAPANAENTVAITGNTVTVNGAPVTTGGNTVTIDADSLTINGHLVRPHNCTGFYPPDLQREGIVGETTLGFTVTSEGSVRHIKILETSGNRKLDYAAGVCAGHWHYFPATDHGKPIEAQSKAKVVWSLPPEPATPEPNTSTPNR